MKRLLLSILSLFLAVLADGAAFAAGSDEITFEVAAPTMVEANELFRIEFVVNAIKDVEFTPPTIEGFDVMAGPSRAVGSSVSIIGGEVSKTETTTYTYVLRGPAEAGLHTVSAAGATVRGKSYSTEPVIIEVVAGANPQAGVGANPQAGVGQTPPAGSTQQTEGQNTSGPKLSDDDIFIRTSVSRSKVYKDEPLVVTLKLYSRVTFWPESFDRVPSFNGFWMQDITSDEQPALQRETYNNRVYNTLVIKEYLLYPQQAGGLTIDPFEVGVTVRIQDPGSSQRDIFDQILGGGYSDIRKKLATQPVRIDVMEWPGGAPGSFDGAVGSFKLETTPPAPAMNVNSSGSYSLRLSGTGNFPLIGAPKLSLPGTFEPYNVTTSDNTRHTRGGTSGYREFSYPFIPRTEGLYTIPRLEFSFFDPGQERYVTLESPETSVEVVADSTAVASTGGRLVSGVSREELEIFGSDIRFIKRGGAELKPEGRKFLWSPLFLSVVAALVMAFAVGLVVLGRLIRNMHSDRFVRSKRANKMAMKRLRAAEVAMSRSDKHGFYDEMLKALWGYISDRLDIPMASLSKERIREELFERSIDEGRSTEYVRIISECEEAQYSPSSSARMNELYREGVSVISELESAIKKG